MRLITLLILFSFCTQSNSDLGDFGESISKIALGFVGLDPSSIAQQIKKRINLAQYYNILAEQVKKALSADKIADIILSAITIEDITKRINNSFKFQQNFNTTANKTILQPVILKPEQPIQFFKNRQEECKSVCQSWYNVLCFLIMRCEEKLMHFKDKMAIPTIIIGIVIVGSLGAYLFSILSPYALFMIWFLTKTNDIVNASIRVFLSLKNFIKKKFHRNDHQNQQRHEQEIQPPPTAERFVR